MSLEAIWLVWIRRDYAARFTWIKRLHCKAHVDHGFQAAKLR